MTPRNLEEICLSVYDRFLTRVTSFADKPIKLNSLAIVLLAAMGSFGIWNWDFWLANNPFGIGFFQLRGVLFFSLLITGLIAPLLSLNGFQVLCWSTVFFASVVALPEVDWLHLLTSFLLTFVLMLLYTWISFRRLSLLMFFAGASALVIGEMTALLYFNQMADSAERGWWLFRPERYLMVVVITVAWLKSQNETPSSIIAQKALFNPIHSLYPLPLFPFEWKTNTDSGVRLSGLFGVAGAMLAMTGASFCHQIMQPLAGERIWNLQLLCGFTTFIYFYLNSWALLTAVVGLLRWWGFDVAWPFHFALLAVSPQDSWRRWNIPFYHWFRNMIFLPVSRATGSVFLGVMAAFAMTFFLHDGTWTLHYIHFSIDEGLFAMIRNKALFFGGHGLAVWVGMNLSKWIPRGDKMSGWLSVAVTTFILSWLHWFVRYY